MQAPLQTLRLFPKLNTKKYIYYTSLINTFSGFPMCTLTNAKPKIRLGDGRAK